MFRNNWNFNSEPLFKLKMVFLKKIISNFFVNEGIKNSCKMESFFYLLFACL